MSRPLAALYLTALLASGLLGPGAAVYWDSFAYVTQSLNGHVGGLLLGRPLFVLASQLTVSLALALKLSPWLAEPLLRALWAAFSALAAPLTTSLARALGTTPRAALLAGLLVALSPASAHTRDAVLTDGPATVLLLASLLLAARRSVFSAGLLLGLATATREPTAAFALAHVALFTSSKITYPQAFSWLGGFSLGLGTPVAWAALSEPAYLATLRQWTAAMRDEQRRFPYGPRDAGMYALWLASLGPTALAFALATALRPALRARVPAAAWRVIVPSALILASLARYQDIAYSPRYLIGAFPCALALPAAVGLDALRSRTALALALASLALPFCAAPALRARERPLVASLAALPSALRALSSDAVIVTGQLCPAVVMFRAMGRRERPAQPPAWITVCPSWRWPDDLAAALDRLRADGHPIVLDTRPTSWLGPRQNRLRAEVVRYATAHPDAARLGEAVVPHSGTP